MYGVPRDDYGHRIFWSSFSMDFHCTVIKFYVRLCNPFSVFFFFFLNFLLLTLDFPNFTSFIKFAPRQSEAPRESQSSPLLSPSDAFTNSHSCLYFCLSASFFPFFLRFFLSTDLSSLSLHSEVRNSFFIPSSSVLYCRFASECLDWTVSLSAEVCSLMSSLRPSWLRFSSMRSSVDETFSFGSFFLFLLGLSGCLLFRE
jgi:hypothetical protein